MRSLILRKKYEKNNNGKAAKKQNQGMVLVYLAFKKQVSLYFTFQEYLRYTR